MTAPCHLTHTVWRDLIPVKSGKGPVNLLWAKFLEENKNSCKRWLRIIKVTVNSTLEYPLRDLILTVHWHLLGCWYLRGHFLLEHFYQADCCKQEGFESNKYQEADTYMWKNNKMELFLYSQNLKSLNECYGWWNLPNKLISIKQTEVEEWHAVR